MLAGGLGLTLLNLTLKTEYIVEPQINYWQQLNYNHVKTRSSTAVSSSLFYA